MELRLDIEDLVRALVAEEVERALGDRTAPVIYDAKAAAEYLRVSTRRIHTLVNEGRLPRNSDIPGGKLYFTRADLDRYALGRNPSNEGQP